MKESVCTIHGGARSSILLVAMLMIWKTKEAGENLPLLFVNPSYC
jgi:hypothetical protein